MQLTEQATRSDRVGPQGLAVARRRTIVVVVVLLAVIGLLMGQLRADADLADRVAGHAVLEPGDTLWDLAAATAPEGMDTREYLAELVALNGFDGTAIDAWTVVLLPVS